MEKFGRFCLLCLYAIFLVSFSAFIFMNIYNWLIVPIYNLNPINFIESLSIEIFLMLITYKAKKQTEDLNKKEIKEFFELLVKFVSFKLFLLMVAYLITVFR